jgi:Uncharacterised nucleotidyltransferase
VHFSPELSFVIGCCRSAFGDPEARRPSSLGSLDGGRVVRLARFHGVQGLVWRAVGADAAGGSSELDDLWEDATAIAASNLKAAAACGNILADFESAGIKLIFLKGLALGALAYGSAAVKSAVDADLLIAPDEIGRAAELLENRGYILTVPARPAAEIRQWHRIRKESVWVAPDSGVQIDLHTRAADNPQIIPAISADSPTRLVDVGNGIELPALESTETFAYLAVHGASSAWFRLKWICDFAALLADKSPSELDALYRKSLRLAAGRAPAQALLLADRLFGTLTDNAALKAELLQDRASRLLYRAALTQLAGQPEPIEPTSRRLGTLRIHWTQFLLMPGLRFKTSELLRQARVPLA